MASRLSSCDALLMPVCCLNTLRADYTTADTLSIEWVAHSSDGIYLVRVGNVPKNAGAAHVELVRVLCEPRQQRDAALQLLNSVGPFRSEQEGDRWLLFVRVWETKPPEIFYRVNLSRPLQSPWTAAITARGTPLDKAEEILKVVEARLQRQQRLSKRERALRESVDGGGIGWGNGFSLESHLGGLMMRINCDLWDTPYEVEDQVGYDIFDEDLGLTGVVVPADPEYHDELLKAAADPEGGPTANWALRALVNYPGEKTEAVLNKLIESKTGAWGTAQMVAWFFRYRYDLSDPLHHELVGRWQLLGHRERMELTFNEDGTFVGYSYARDSSEPLWEGGGYWLLHEKTLTLHRHVQRHLTPEKSRERPGWFSNHRTIFRDKPILRTTPKEVFLKDGPVMTRLGPLEGSGEDGESANK
jgi:hypothetical protein